MTTHSRYFADFDVAGMRYWDGALVLEELKAGMALELEAEPDNPFDPDAVALCWEGTKIGYLPREVNTLPALLLRFGHDDVLECRILCVNREATTWKQIHAGLYVTDQSDDE